ncbi:MAG: TonB-dependent receptor [Marinicellaceae bacterium]
MKTIKRDNEFLPKKSILSLLIISLMSFSSVTYSQDDDQTNEEETDEDVVELAPIVATGSRLLRETYESISPVQVITAQQSRAVGQINADDILQNSTAASGQQIDLTFSGFVLDNGPGATTVSFRNLGPGRTLFLLNGRRVGASGVEGVPSAADLSLVPGGLIERYELLLDGASSLYGSDAVAGVANAILRKDFNGFEVDYNLTVPEQSGGIENTVAVTWGQNYDRGFIGFGAQINESEEIKFADRDWTGRCAEHREEDMNGNITSQDLFTLRNNLMDLESCTFPLLVGRFILPGNLGGSIYFTEGSSSGGFGNWTDSSVAGIPWDSNSDGVADINFGDYGTFQGVTGGSLQAERKTQNLMSYGEYTFEGENNITPYYEALYSRRDTFQDSGQPQFFPFIPADNPYNLCNPDAIGGIDCGLAFDQAFEDPAFIAAYIAENGCDPSASGDCPQAGGARGALRTRAVVGVRGDRDTTSATVKQYRVVAGLKGDLPGMDWGQMSNWNFDTYLSYNRSEGLATRAGIREDRYDYSVETSRIDPVTGEVVCGNNDGCVPINMFAPSLYNAVVGDFATQAERDYLFDLRTFNTKIQQTMFSAFLNGYVYELPAGPLAAGIGVEIREDEIESIPDEIARDGLFFGFFSDAGAVGKKTTKEVFAEVNVPLLAGYKGAEQLDFNISGRLTKDEFFPSADTFSAKLGYRPIPSLFLKATLGTSYRAPNLRENFLLAQSGFNNVGDPCVVPDAVYDGVIDPDTGEVITPVDSYSATLDDQFRGNTVITNCTLQGAPPAAIRDDNLNGGFSSYQTEITSGGSTNVTEEQSDSLTYGFAWDVPFDNDFNMTVGATYYEIEVNNTIVESTTGSIINGCYRDEDFNSTLCQRVVRGTDGLITNVDAGFVNRDNLTVRGIDINLNVDTTVDIFEKPVDFGLDVVLTRTKENSELFLGEAGPEDDELEDFTGDFGLPRWSGTVNLRARYDDFRVNWQTRYIGDVSVDVLDYFGNIEGVDTIDVRDIDGDGDTSEVLTIFSDTCEAPNLCRDVGDADDYFVHTLSVFWEKDDWTVGFGIRNIFNDEPPEVDPSEAFVIGNAPIGQGYDLNGRRYFLNVGKRF